MFRRPVTDTSTTMDCARADDIEAVADLTGLIGETPLVSLRTLIVQPDVACYGKVEYFNPSGSVKDRIAVALLDDAERRGLLAPGATVIEPSSGNTGTALAMACAIRSYTCVIVTPEKTSAEKVATMRAYGAQVVVAPNVAREDPRHYTRVAARLAAETPGAYMPDQYSNPVNALACRQIGREIWRQTRGRVTHVVAGLGTGGTACGIAAALKGEDPAITVVGVEPGGSIYGGGEPRPFAIEGIGRHYIPESLDLSLIDTIENVEDDEAFAMTRRVAREAGLLIGGSSGAALVASARVARRARPGSVVVAMLPDSGRAYLSKIFAGPPA